MIISAIMAAAPFLLRFVGEGALGTFLDHRKAMADNGTEQQRIRANADIKKAEHELKRRELQRDLQLKEMETWWIYAPKALLMWAVSLYLSAIIGFSLFSLKTAYGVTIEDLPPRMWDVVLMVLAYWFLDKAVTTFTRK